MFEKLSEELKEARLKNNITLEQMAAKTRIDLKFLQFIEDGNFTFLPDLYVKAFIKEYSNLVGLDDKTIIKKYEAAKRGKVFDEATEKTPSDQEDIKPTIKYTHTPDPSNLEETSNFPPEGSTNLKKKQLYRVAVIVSSLVLIILVYLIFLSPSNEIIVAEKPIEDVVAENQHRYVEDVNNRKDSLAAEATAYKDSLHLIIQATDTSWIKIMLDDRQAEEFILFPKSQKEISARSNYKLTIGNSGGVRFFLNNKPLNFNGKKNEVLHIQIDNNGLTLLNTPPTFEQR